MNDKWMSYVVLGSGVLYFIGYIFFMIKNWNNDEYDSWEFMLYWFGGTIVISLISIPVLYIGTIIGIPYGLFYGLRQLTRKKKK